MNIVSFGGGTNSTAMIIGMWQRNMPIDIIFFSDTGAEKPHTYRHIDAVNTWLAAHGLPKMVILEYTDKNGERLTLEQDCLIHDGLPGATYGKPNCAAKHKISVLEKYCNNHPDCRDAWARGEKIDRFIGYDAGEQRRVDKNQHIYDADKKYRQNFPLIEWGWNRADCIAAIEREGLELPGKSSCFFCPNNKKDEIQKIWENYPDLWERILTLERNARKTRRDGTASTIIGLGRTWTWESYREKYSELVEAKANQLVLPGFEESTGGCCCGMPCGCYDG